MEIYQAEIVVSAPAQDGPPPPEKEPPEKQPEEIGGMTEDDMVAFVLERKTRAEESQAELRERMEENWRAYRNEIDYSAKEEWMAKIRLPRPRTIVKKGTSVIHHILLQQDKYIKFEPRQIDSTQRKQSPFGDDVKQAELANKSALYYLDRAQFTEKALEAVEGAFAVGHWWAKLGWETQVEDKIISVLKRLTPDGEPVDDDYQGPVQTRPVMDPATGLALLDGMGNPAFEPIKEWHLDRVEQPVSTLSLDLVEPWSLFSDPKQRYFIEESETTLAEIMEQAQADAHTYYDPEKVRLLKEEDYESQAESERLNRLHITQEKDGYDKGVVVHEYWGDVINKEGELVLRNARLIIANEKYLLNWSPGAPDDPRNPMKNPYWHGKPPYIALSPMRVVGRKEGEALHESVQSMWKHLNHLINMGLDHTLIRTLGLPQVFIDRLVNPADAERLIPGRPIWIRRRAEGPAVIDTPIADIPASLSYLTELMFRELQGGSMVPDTILGLSPVRGMRTATEASYHEQNAASYFESVAANIEKFFAQCGEMCRQLILQFGLGPDAPPDLLRVFEQEVAGFAGMPPAQRVMFLQSDMDIRCKGISAYFRMAEALKRVLELIEIGSKWEPLGMMFNHREVAERIMQNSALPDADGLLISKEEAEKRMQKMSAGQGGPGPAGAPPPGEKEALVEQMAAMLKQVPPEQREAAAQGMALNA